MWSLSPPSSSLSISPSFPSLPAVVFTGSWVSKQPGLPQNSQENRCFLMILIPPPSLLWHFFGSAAGIKKKKVKRSKKQLGCRTGLLPLRVAGSHQPLPFKVLNGGALMLPFPLPTSSSTK